MVEAADHEAERGPTLAVAGRRGVEASFGARLLGSLGLGGIRYPILDNRPRRSSFSTRPALTLRSWGETRPHVRNTAYKPLFRDQAEGTSEQVRKEKLITYLRFIAANTRRWRLRRGLTQEVLAELADLDLRFIQRIERGSTNLSISVLIALADALDVNPTVLFRAAKLTPARPGRPRKQPARGGASG